MKEFNFKGDLNFCENKNYYILGCDPVLNLGTLGQAENSIVLGENSIVLGENSIVFGENSIVLGENSTDLDNIITSNLNSIYVDVSYRPNIILIKDGMEFKVEDNNGGLTLSRV